MASAGRAPREVVLRHENDIGAFGGVPAGPEPRAQILECRVISEGRVRDAELHVRPYSTRNTFITWRCGRWRNSGGPCLASGGRGGVGIELAGVVGAGPGREYLAEAVRVYLGDSGLTADRPEAHLEATNAEADAGVEAAVACAEEERPRGRSSWPPVTGASTRACGSSRMGSNRCCGGSAGAAGTEGPLSGR